MATENTPNGPCGPMNMVLPLGQRIKWVRISNKLTQKDFAEQIGVSRSYLSEVEGEKGKPSIEMIVGIANIFPGINSYWLLTGKGPFIKEEADRAESYLAQIDKIALRVSLGSLYEILKGEDLSPPLDGQSLLLAMLYDTYMAAYTRALDREEGEQSARTWGGHAGGAASAAFDPRFLGASIAFGPSIPINPDADK